MFWSICSVKGGVGTSVVAASLALELVAQGREVVLVDLCGDQPSLLGVDVAEPRGVVDWLSADGELVDGALAHLLVDIGPGLRLLPSGSASLRDARGVDPRRCTQLATAFDPEVTVVADMGALPADPMSPHALISVTADRRTAVLRACYLTLRRTNPLPIDVDSVIEIAEPGRALTTLDIELVVQQPVAAKLRVDPTIARAVDAGLLTTRRPRPLRRAMRDLIASGIGTSRPEAIPA